jgi:drug/metabolite transporter (DMT)-like permease
MTAHLGELAALATACCWVVTAFAFESAGRRVGSLVVNLLRLVMAIVLLGTFTWITRGLFLPTDATPRAWLWLSLSGVVGFTVGDGFLFRAFVLIGSRLSLLLMSLVPPLTAIIGWLLLGEVLGPRELAGMALTVAGVSWVVLERQPATRTGGGRLPLGGVLLGVGAAAGQATGLVLSKFGMAGYDPFAATQIRVMAGTAGFMVLFTFVGWWPRVAAALEDRGAIGRTAVGAFFGPFLGVSLSLVAITYTATGVAATIIALMPVLVIPPSVVLFKDRVSARAVAGSLVAVAGTGLLFL